jgi:hypothetical protein
MHSKLPGKPLTNPGTSAGLTAVLCLLLPLCSLAAADTPVAGQVAADNLQLVEKDRRSSLYADPAADWSAYREVQLLEAPVSFRKHWQRDQNRFYPFKVKDEDVEEIKADLSSLLNEVLTEELTEDGGYALAQATGAQVLVIQPAIVELDIAAPDTMIAGINRQYTDSNGRMTLQFELIDSVSGKVLARSSDRYEDPRRGWYEWTNAVTNQAEARRLFRRWASELRERLDEGHFSADPALAMNANR